MEGEAGIGKTSLLRRFLAGVGEGRNVVLVAAAEEERSLSFGVFDQFAAGLTGDSRALVPDDESDADPLAAGARLLAVLGAADGVTILVIDDLHWADPHSASALLFTLRRLRNEAVLVVLATRPDPAGSLTGSWGRFSPRRRPGPSDHARGLDGRGVDAVVRGGCW